MGSTGFLLGLWLGDGLPWGFLLGLGMLSLAWAKLGRRTAGVLAVLCFGILLGGWRGEAAGSRPQELPLRNLSPDVPVIVEGRIFSHPENTDEERLRFVLIARRVEQKKRTWKGELAIHTYAPAEVAEAALLGRRVRIRGYMVRSTNVVGMRPASRGPFRLSLKSPRFLEVLEEEPFWVTWGIRGRQGITELLDRRPGRGGPVARALVLGDRSRLPDSWIRASRATGTAHLLAVSGLHVALLALVAFGLASPFSRGPFARTLRLALPAVAVVAYWLLVGPKPSVTRAALMSLWLLISVALRRPPQGVPMLVGSAGLMAWIHPPWIEDLGFRLSFGATAALILVTPWLAERWIRELRPRLWLRGIFWSLGASIAAQAVTGPILWPVSGLIHPLSPLLDLVAVPWLGVLLILSWAGVVLQGAVEGAIPAWGPAVNGMLGTLGDVFLLPVAWGAAAEPGPFHGIPVPSTVGWLWGPLVLAAVARGPRGSARRLVLLAIFLGMATGSSANRGRIEVIFLDVGQGDAVLLRSADRAILVDGGGRRRGDVAGRLLVPALADLGIRRLDAVALTHPDTDHCRGLAGLRSYLPVTEIWTSAGWSGPCVGELVKRRGARLRRLHGGMNLREGPFHAEVLWPKPGDRREGNDRSLVLRIRVDGGPTLLLTGDLEASGERALARSGVDLRADLLKAGHHGSKTSTTAEFLDAVAPRTAVLSAGRRNRYGHPHGSVVGRLESRGIVVLRTDRHGTIRWTRREGGGPWILGLPNGPVP